MKKMINYESFSHAKEYWIQILRIMKISILLLLICISGVYASSYSQVTKLTVHVKSATVKEVFNLIQEQSEFIIFYKDSQVDLNRKVNIDVDNSNVKHILDQIFTNTNLNYKIIERQIVITPDKEKSGTLIKKKAANVVQPQERTIQGRVTDEKGLPLPGVSVIVKGTTIGITTDTDGNYSLQIPNDAKALVFSFVGMASREIAINGQTVINTELTEETIGLAEVVAVGYGIKQKKDLTGAVSVVDVGDIVSTPVAGIDQMLQGQMAGVDIVGDYMPGGGVAVRVRGYSTIRNNEPLYIIDGVPVESGINMINPNDIQSLQVLKDASSASIYGSRAANGVVIITTKKGKLGEPRINFNAYVGIQSATNKLDVLDAQEYGDMLWEAHKNDGKSPANDIYGSGPSAVIPDFLDKNRRVPSANVDWVDEIMQNALVHSYNLSLSKGSKRSKQAFSIGYFDQEGIIKHTNFKRLTTRFNSENKFFNALTIGENLSISQSWTNQAQTNSVLGSVVYDSYKYPSIAPVHDLDGNFAGAFLSDIRNPLASLYYNRDNTRKRLKLFGNVYAELEIVKGLKFKTNFGVDYSNYYFRDFNPKYQETGAHNPITLSRLSTTNSWKFDWVWTNTVSYNAKFEKHSVEAIAGTEAIESTFEIFSASREGFAYEDKNFRYLDAGEGGSQKNSGTGLSSSLLSYFAKVDYTYDNRYLATFTFRRDGSSKLGNNNWGNFPAFSLGWRITEEDFFNSDKISNLKMRFGWGQNGNQDVPPYATIESYYSNPYHSNYAIDGAQNSVYTGFTQSRNGNPNLKWETTTQTNIGFDLGLLDNHFNITADYFIKETRDLLLERPLPPIAGGTNQTVWDNVGKMRNNGFEVVIDYQSQAKGDFLWNVSLNFTHIKNELTELPGDIDFIALPSSYLHSVNFDQETSRSEVGHPISSFYGYKSLGVFKSQAEIDAHKIQPNAKPGDLKFADLTNDGELNSDDRDFIGDPHPDLTMGLNLDFQYKNFDLRIFFNGSFGNEVWDLTRYYGDFFDLSAYNKFARTVDAWSENNTGSPIPRLSLDDPNNNIRPSSYYISDASYVRLKNLTIGYTFKKLAGKINSRNLRVYLQVQNLITFTGYKGLDPEVGLQNYSSDHRNLDIGVDRGLYPPSRTFMLGVDVGF